MADNALLVARARAERERRRRLAQRNEAELDQPTSFMDKAKSAANYAGMIANELNVGILSILPSAARNKLQELGVGVPGTEFGKTRGGAATKYVGMAVPMMAGVPAAGARMATTLGQPGIWRGMIDDITNFAMANPKLYFTSEVAGAAGAGAAGEMAREGGAGTGGQLIAEMLGGMTAGGLTSIGPRSLRGLRESIQKNIFPMTKEGGMIRAAKQTQQRAGGPETAQAYAKSLAEIPEGVTPAQWIGDERLMAQESRLLQDNPELANRVRSELQEAHLAAQESLKDSFGRPRTRQEWEVSVLERVTPEGTLIEPGMTDDMLGQAYDSFAPLYDQAKGFDVSTSGLTQKISDSVYDPSIIAGDLERDSIRKWFNNVASAFEDQIEFDEIPSDALLQIRSKVRDQRRLQSRRGNAERADLLGAIEGSITKRLEDALPDDITAQLKVTDSQYRKYKIVENSIFNAADANLSPEQLTQAIRMGGLTSQSRYARGVDEATQDLRRLALAGRSTEEVLGDPQRAAMFVRDLSDIEKRAVQADFADVLFNRAKSAAATESGIPLLSGEKLLRDLTENMDVMKNLGMTPNDITRLRTIGRELQTVAKKSPQAVKQLFEDGPASVLQLVAAIIGAHSGQKMAGGGLGASLVLAQFMSNRARRFLARITSDQAERLMKDAVTDQKLYQALLTRPTVGVRVARERAAYLESWLLASAFDKSGEDNARD